MSKKQSFKEEVKEVFKKEDTPKSKICSVCLADFETEGVKSKKTWNKKTLYTAQHKLCKDGYDRVYFTADPYTEVQAKDTE